MRITQEIVNDLRRRFHDFYDSVVCSVSIRSWPAPQACEIVLSAKDSLAASGWSEVRFWVRDVSEFRFQRGRRAFEVLSSGLQITSMDGKVYVVLDAYPDDGPGLPDLATNIAYVVGAACDVQIASLPVR